MAEGEVPAAQNTSLTLGFLGLEDVHRLTAKELLDDFIAAFRKNHRKAEIRFYISVDPFTSTMSFLADYALTQGYRLGLIGHEQAYKDQAHELAGFLKPAEGLTIRLTGHADLARSMVSTLAVYDESRLILLSDPNSDEDEIGYQAAEYAHEKGIPCRSLLHGLDRVRMEEEEEETTAVGRDDLRLVEEDGGDDFEFEGSDEDEEEAFEESFDGGVDDDEEVEGVIDEDGYFDTESDEDVEPDEEVDEAVIAAGVDDEDFEESEDEDIEDAEEVVPEDEEPGEEEPEEERVEEPMAKWTQAQLEKLEKEDLYAAAAEYGIYPGRGIKQSMMIARILEAEGGSAKPKKAPAKKTKKAPVKASPAKKKAPAKKTPARRAAPAKTPVKASTNGHVAEADARQFIELAEASLKIAKSLV